MKDIIFLVLQSILQLLRQLLKFISGLFGKLKFLLRHHLLVPQLEQFFLHQLELFTDSSKRYLVMERPFHQSLRHEHGLTMKES